jgi:hypothetical protein
MARVFSLKITTALLGAVAALMFLALPASPAKAQDLDMKEIFRCQAKDKPGIAACDKSRELILNNCTTCHIFVAIVVQQFDKAGWDGLFERHRDRAAQLNDTQINEMKAYLAANFNPQIDPPDVPPELLKEWTAY